MNKKPTFIYAGAAKAGSSWLYEILCEHPEVFMPKAKELMFFDRFYEKGLDWYINQFSNLTDEKVCGELSHNYFLDPQVAERIKKDRPDIKLIFCLREGVDRTFSSYIYDKTLFTVFSKKEHEQGVSFEEFALHAKVIRQSDYFNNLKPYFDIFPHENILILFFDDLKKQPEKFASDIYQFLEVDSSFTPSVLHKKINVAREARSDFLANLAHKVGVFIRKHSGAGIVGSLKRTSWFENILYKPYKNNKPKPSEENVLALKKTYHKDYDLLSELIKKPLPKEWL